MSKHLKLAALWCLGLVFVVSAQGADEKKGLMIGGSFEGGYSYGWQATPAVKESQFFVDDLNMKFNVNVSDKTKVVLDQHFSVAPQPGTANSITNDFNSSATFGRAQLASGGFVMAAESAYIEHKCAENFHTQVGFVRVPFGMEAMANRYDSNTHYHSFGFNRSHALGWDSDLGVNFKYTGFGTLELAVLDGRQVGSATVRNNHSPATALRWNGEFKAGEMTISPEVATYVGRWHSSPGDLGFSLGTAMKMSSFWANLEYMYLSNSPGFVDASKVKQHNISLEPGFDFGMVNLSAKWELNSQTIGTGTGNSDMNIGFGVSHEYAEKYRVKLAYNHTNLGGKAFTGTTNGAPHLNDIRLLFGTKW